MKTTQKKTGLIVLALIVVLFVVLWGIDAVDSNNELEDIENIDGLAIHDSSRLSSLYGFNPAVIPTVGDPEAPILMIEFSNFFCGVCANYHNGNFNVLMEKYGDQIQYASVYIFSDAYSNVDLTMATTCAYQQGAFEEFVDYAYNLPKKSLAKDDFISKAGELGLDEGEFAACIENEDYRDALKANEKIARELGVYSTPFFSIDGFLFAGAPSLDFFDSILEQSLAKVQ